MQLVQIVREAVELQPEAEAALRALATEEGAVTPWVRTAGRAAGRYWELLQLLDEPQTPAQRRAAELIDYHQQLLIHTMRFACSLQHVGMERLILAQQQAHGGFGRPAQRLRDLLAELEA
jgi:hypothetical protein